MADNTNDLVWLKNREMRLQGELSRVRKQIKTIEDAKESQALDTELVSEIETTDPQPDEQTNEKPKKGKKQKKDGD